MIKLAKTASFMGSVLIFEIVFVIYMMMKLLTFSQLLIKARQKEEEEMTSKLVNKGSVMENTLEERVDQLIAKSNQEPPPNRRGNPNNHSFDGAPYTPNQRSERNPNPNFQELRNNIRQNL